MKPTLITTIRGPITAPAPAPAPVSPNLKRAMDELRRAPTSHVPLATNVISNSAGILGFHSIELASTMKELKDV